MCVCVCVCVCVEGKEEGIWEYFYDLHLFFMPARHQLNAKAELAQLFLQACSEHEQSPALITDSAVFNYKWLHSSAVVVESLLSRAQVRPCQVVALCIPPGPVLVATVMGCILRGAVFLMVDTSLPMLRKKIVMEASKPCVVINWTQRGQTLGQDTFENAAALTFTASLDENNSLQMFPDDPTKVSISQTFACSSNTLYVMFTSGSTASPKGVCASATGTLNRFRWMWDTFPFKQGDVLCFKTSVLFVDSIWEIFGSILKGTPLVIPSLDAARDPRLLSSFIRKHQVTHVTATPTLLQHLLELAGAAENLRTLVLCFVSGEPLSAALCSRFFSILPSCRLVNLYGTTEICADVTFFEATPEYLSKSSGPLVPIGKPISNIHVEIFDPLNGAIVHKENLLEQGELVVCGPCVAEGYLDCSNQSSVENPSMEKCTSFNTHDIVHYTSSGDLMYVGRRDHQIKLGGIKINPCEVEALLEQYSGVIKAAVVASESKSSLVGFVQMSQLLEVANESKIEFSFKGINYMSSQWVNRKLSEHLKQSLPKNCIPSQFMCTHTLPCLPSGKINRMQLPSTSDIATLVSSSDTTSKQVLSRTEETLIELFAQTLGLGHLTPNLSDDFMSMGGNSLSAIDLSVQLEKRFGYSVLVHDLLSGISIKSLASMIDDWLFGIAKSPIAAPSNPTELSERASTHQLASDVTSIPIKCVYEDKVLDNPDEHPLLLTQHMVWLAQQTIETEGIVIEIAALCRVAVDVDCLRQSVLHLFLRHETLRTLIRENKRGVPFRHIIPLYSPEFFKMHESVFRVQSCLTPAALQRNEIPIYDGNQMWLPKFNFNLPNGPLWQATFFKDVKNGTKDGFVDILVFQLHHIIADGWSLKILMTELENIYGHLATGGSMDNLHEQQHNSPVVDMADIVKDERDHLQDQATVSRKLSYWVNQLKHCTAPMLLPAERSFSLAYIEMETSSIYRNLQLQKDTVEAALKSYGVSEFVLTYASFLLAMYAATGSQDVTIYLPVANRTTSSVHVVGMVVETLPLRVRMHPNMTLTALLHSVKTAALELFQNMHPYVLVDQWVRNNGNIYVSHPISGHYLQTMFVFDYDRTTLFSDSSVFREIPVCEHFTACAITIYVHMNQFHEQLSVHIIYNHDWFDVSTINTFLGVWEAVIPVLSDISHFDKPLDALSKQVCASLSRDEVGPNLTVDHLPSLPWAASLAIPLGSSSSIHVCHFHMECILNGMRHTVEFHSIAEIVVLYPTSALLCAIIAAAICLKRDVCVLPSKEALCNYLMRKQNECSVLALLTHSDQTNINNFLISKHLSRVHIISAESLLLPSSHLQPSSTDLITKCDQDDTKMMNCAHTAPPGSCKCLQFLPLNVPEVSPTQIQCIRLQDVLTALNFLRTFQFSSQPAISIFTTPLCPTFPIAIALLLEGIPFQIHTDTDVGRASSLADLIGIQESDLLIVPDILVPRLIQDLPQTWPRKQIWIQGLPLGLAHVSKSAEKLFTQVLVTHSLLPNDLLITHYFNLDSSTVPPLGASWTPMGHAASGINWKVEHPDGRQVIPGFPGRFAIVSANKTILHSKAIVKQATSGRDAGAFKMLSLDYEAYYRGNDLTPLVILLGQLPDIKWCHRSREGVLFVDCADDKDAIVAHVLDHLQPSFVNHMYTTSYPPVMGSHFSVDAAQPSSSCITASVVVNDRYQMVLDKLTGIVSRVFCIRAEEIEEISFMSSIDGYCMENYFQLTLELNCTFKTSLTFKEVSKMSTMSELVTLVLHNM